MDGLIGVGLYTPAEAGRLLRMPAAKIARWLRGHSVKGKDYAPLWAPEVDLGDDQLILGFRDLMEFRVADALMRRGVSAISIRRAIDTAREVLGMDHPLATQAFRTDGREIFLQTVDKGDDGVDRERILNLLKRQYEFAGVIDPVLQTIDFDKAGVPEQWWPSGRTKKIVVDPMRAFGAPIDSDSGVPTHILADAGNLMGAAEAAAAYDVREAAVRRAMDFEASLTRKAA